MFGTIDFNDRYIIIHVASLQVDWLQKIGK
jgi:hypothetical protein